MTTGMAMSGHNMVKTSKSLLVLLLALALVFSFAACGKDDADGNSSGTPSVPVQDYEDEWGELPDDEEQDKITESLWQELGSGSATLEDTDDVQTESDNSSSTETSSETTSSEDTASTNSDLSGVLTDKVDALF